MFQLLLFTSMGSLTLAHQCTTYMLFNGSSVTEEVSGRDEMCQKEILMKN